MREVRQFFEPSQDGDAKVYDSDGRIEEVRRCYGDYAAIYVGQNIADYKWTVVKIDEVREGWLVTACQA